MGGYRIGPFSAEWLARSPVAASTGTEVNFSPRNQVFIRRQYRIRSVRGFSFYRCMHSPIHQVVFPSTWRNVGTDLGDSQSQVTKSTSDRDRNSNKYPYK